VNYPTGANAIKQSLSLVVETIEVEFLRLVYYLRGSLKEGSERCTTRLTR